MKTEHLSEHSCGSRHASSGTARPFRMCCVRHDLVPTVQDLATWIAGRTACGTIPPLGGTDSPVATLSGIDSAGPGTAVVIASQSAEQAFTDSHLALARGACGIITQHPMAAVDGRWVIRVPAIQEAANRLVSAYLHQSRARTILVDGPLHQAGMSMRLVAQRIRGMLRACGHDVSQIIRWGYTSKPAGRKNQQGAPWCVVTSDSFPCAREVWDGCVEVAVRVPGETNMNSEFSGPANDEFGCKPSSGGCLVSPVGSPTSTDGRFDLLQYGEATAHVACEPTNEGGHVRFSGQTWKYANDMSQSSNVWLWGSAVAAVLAVVPCSRRVVRAAQLQWEMENTAAQVKAA